MFGAVMEGHRTVRSVAARVGLAVFSTHWHLSALRDAGLIDWVDDRHGTIHSVVHEVRLP